MFPTSKSMFLECVLLWNHYPAANHLVRSVSLGLVTIGDKAAEGGCQAGLLREGACVSGDLAGMVELLMGGDVGDPLAIRAGA